MASRTPQWDDVDHSVGVVSHNFICCIFNSIPSALHKLFISDIFRIPVSLLHPGLSILIASSLIAFPHSGINFLVNHNIVLLVNFISSVLSQTLSWKSWTIRWLVFLAYDLLPMGNNIILLLLHCHLEVFSILVLAPFVPDTNMLLDRSQMGDLEVFLHLLLASVNLRLQSCHDAVVDVDCNNHRVGYYCLAYYNEVWQGYIIVFGIVVLS
jgi:hypothetical protein